MSATCFSEKMDAHRLISSRNESMALFPLGLTDGIDGESDYHGHEYALRMTTYWGKRTRPINPLAPPIIADDDDELGPA